jgi:hypothetical protein
MDMMEMTALFFLVTTAMLLCLIAAEHGNG